MRVSLFRTAICAVALAVAGRATAQEAKPDFRFEFHGFVGGSVCAQDFVGNSQCGGVYFATNQPNQDKLSFTGDVRQTRLQFSLAGPKVFGGATPKAIAELDFFGQLNSGAATTTVTGTTQAFVPSTNAFTNLTPRARMLVAELNWGNTILHFGQESDLTLHVTPTSVGHIPQALTYDAGTIGHRHAGIFVFQTIPVMDDYKVELALQVTRSGYNDGTGAGMTGAYLSTAEASGLPMVAARAKLKHKIFEFSATGLWNQVDLSGVNQVNPATNQGNQETRDVFVGVVALKASYMGFTLQGSAYAGKNTIQLTPSFGQAAPATTTSATSQAGDLHDMGAWVQLGYNITPELSAWALAGKELMNPNEIRDSGNKIWGNSLVSAMLRYMEGGYAIGLEYAHFETMYIDGQTPAGSLKAAPNGVVAGNQISLSGFYFF